MGKRENGEGHGSHGSDRISQRKVSLRSREASRSLRRRLGSYRSGQYSLLIETILGADFPEEQDKASKKREAVAEEEATYYRKRLKKGHEEPRSLINSMGIASASTSYLRESVGEGPEKSLKSPDKMLLPAPKCGENGEGSKNKSFEIACSTIGGKKVALVCEVSNFPDFQMPEMEAVSDRVEERYPAILGHGFSLVDLMKEIGKSVLESMEDHPSPDPVDAYDDDDDVVGTSEDEAGGADQELEVEEEAATNEITYRTEKQECENDEVGDARERMLDNDRGNRNCGDGEAGDAQESSLGGNLRRRASIRRKIHNHSNDFYYF